MQHQSEPILPLSAVKPAQNELLRYILAGETRNVKDIDHEDDIHFYTILQKNLMTLSKENRETINILVLFARALTLRAKGESAVYTPGTLFTKFTSRLAIAMMQLNEETVKALRPVTIPEPSEEELAMEAKMMKKMKKGEVYERIIPRPIPTATAVLDRYYITTIESTEKKYLVSKEIIYAILQ